MFNKIVGIVTFIGLVLSFTHLSLLGFCNIKTWQAMDIAVFIALWAPLISAAAVALINRR